MLLRLQGSIFAYAVKKRFSYRTLLTGVVFVFAAGLLCLSIVKGYSGLVAIFFICVVSGIIEPLADGYLHHRIDSSMRATLDSFQSLGLRAMLIIVGLGFGFFSSRYDIFRGYRFIALVCCLFWVYFITAPKEVIE